MHNFTISDSLKGDEWNKRDGDTVSTTIGHSSDSRPLLLLLLSLGGAGVVLAVSTLILCCYFYRARIRRRNYPLTLNLDNNGLTVAATGNAIGTRYDGSSRLRSPVTTEADIYGFDSVGGARSLQLGAGYPKITEDIDNEKKSPPGFDNPLYQKRLPSIIGQSLELPSILDRLGDDAGISVGKCSISTASAILPGLPAMLVVDEAVDDHRRLVPNDSLSLEIDRSQRWLRDNLEARRQLYEQKQLNAEDADLPSIDGQEISMAASAYTADGASKSRVPQVPLRKKLRRRLAETIANDRVLETTVTFANDNSVSPATTPTPLLPWNAPSFSAIAEKRGLDIKKKYDSDDDDLEVVFKERTPL